MCDTKYRLCGSLLHLGLLYLAVFFDTCLPYRIVRLWVIHHSSFSKNIETVQDYYPGRQKLLICYPGLDLLSICYRGTEYIVDFLPRTAKIVDFLPRTAKLSISYRGLPKLSISYPGLQNICAVTNKYLIQQMSS
jgi:hypothetical protein